MNVENLLNGCRILTYVAGTNGGRMPCGASLEWFTGKTTVQYCGACEAARDAVAAFVSAPLRCEGCDRSARDVGAYNVTIQVTRYERENFRSTYCRDCFRIVDDGHADGLRIDRTERENR